MRIARQSEMMQVLCRHAEDIMAQPHTAAAEHAEQQFNPSLVPEEVHWKLASM